MRAPGSTGTNGPALADPGPGRAPIAPGATCAPAGRRRSWLRPRLPFLSIGSVLGNGLGRATAIQIYTDQNGLLTRTLVNAREEAGRNFVEIEDIVVRRIRLPETIRTAIEQKLTQRQLLQSYRFGIRTAEQEAERQRIDAAGIRDYRQIVGETLTERLLTHQGILATREIAGSQSSKTLVIGAGTASVPIVVGAETAKALVPPTSPSR
jgi:prohibitin 1